MKHKEMMRKWLDGEQVQFVNPYGDWVDLPQAADCTASPLFSDDRDYRVKPKQTPAQALGLKEGDYVAIVRENHDRERNGLFVLTEDDGSAIPYFKRVMPDGSLGFPTCIDLGEGHIKKVEF